MPPSSETRERETSPLAEALASVGDRWTLLVVEALLSGPLRFNDLLAEVPGLAPNILTQRLRHLERQRLVVAQPYSERPPRSLYELTPAGRELAGAMRLLADWGARHSDVAGEVPRHRACGSSLEARWYCPTCGEAVDDDEGENLHFM
jgi:DNA-binding HxlR family transcriptional regulator